MNKKNQKKIKNINYFPIATAFRQSIRNYSAKKFRSDFIAAFIVSLIALPLSMALSIAIGLPPQHGIYTAIVAGIVVPLLGGSMWQVSGPTAAFVVILAPIVSELGMRGIVWCSLLAGFFLIIMGAARLGKLINYVPYPVTTGFTAGIAVVLATLSLNDFLGLRIEKLDGEYIEKAEKIISHIPNTNPGELAVGAVTLFLLFTSGRFIRLIPNAVIALTAGILLSLLLIYHYGIDIETIGSRFSWINTAGKKMPGIPPYPPIFDFPTFTKGSIFSIPTFAELKIFLFPSMAIAVLAAIESLLSATVADGMARTKHDPNAELVGIGIGNILSGLASGIPATGAIARTSININNGAKTVFSSPMHAVLIMIFVLILAPYISIIPMSCLAALLIHTAYRMSHIRQFIKVIQIAPRSDIVVLLSCFILTVFIDMVAGVSVGMVMASFLLVKRVTEMTHVEIEKPTSDEQGERPLSDEQVPENTMVYRIHGPLFFGSIEKAFDHSRYEHDAIDNFIVDLSDVPFIDMTGLVAMRSFLESAAGENCAVRIVSAKNDVAKKIKQKISDMAERQYVHFHLTVRSALNARRTGAVPDGE